ncbi:MAG TPA: DinB family protein [Homoserinimonas sp.]|nr:DinB family protein [Homoserinimonas sp.]
MAITPDSKNWTWTAERQCPECGFDASAIDRLTVPERVRENSTAWAAALQRDDVRDRPNDHTWSPLEYAAHVRDVHRVYAQRLARFLVEDNPTFLNWDQDEAAVADRYNEQDPATVVSELVQAAEVAASGFQAVPADAWTRTAERSDGATFTLDSFARYYLHDVVHHLWDVSHQR